MALGTLATPQTRARLPLEEQVWTPVKVLMVQASPLPVADTLQEAVFYSSRQLKVALTVAHHILRFMRQALVIMGVFIFIVGLWLACWFGLKCYIPEQDKRGQFGDQFGTVNSLFAGLAFAAVVVTLVYQHRDSRRQEERFREELEQRKRDSTAEEERAKADLARREQEFAKQIRLRALAAYADLSKELWQNCERQMLEAKKSENKALFDEWDKHRQDRYNQMMKTYADLETMLKETDGAKG